MAADDELVVILAQADVVFNKLNKRMEELLLAERRLDPVHREKAEALIRDFKEYISSVPCQINYDISASAVFYSGGKLPEKHVH